MITIERARALRKLIEKASSLLEDTDAIDAVELFPKWEVGVFYKVDERIRYGEKLYRVVQAHTSQADWTPDVTPALFTDVAEPGEIPVWKQPTGAQDAYNIGDRVYYPDKSGHIYESTINGNVWSPEGYPAGWLIIQ